VPQRIFKLAEWSGAISKVVGGAAAFGAAIYWAYPLINTLDTLPETLEAHENRAIAREMQTAEAVSRQYESLSASVENLRGSVESLWDEMAQNTRTNEEVVERLDAQANDIARLDNVDTPIRVLNGFVDEPVYIGDETFVVQAQIIKQGWAVNTCAFLGGVFTLIDDRGAREVVFQFTPGLVLSSRPFDLKREFPLPLNRRRAMIEMVMETTFECDGEIVDDYDPVGRFLVRAPE
jgi:hypothetical protein